ncbi:MAG: UDP-glucose 4-epimerase [Marinoscillum sp.]|jgi:UDP-glucose 4-epimerase
MKVLITGANGFLGSHLVEQSLLLGYETTAALRKGADLSNLSELKGFQFLEMDYSSEESISDSLRDLLPQDLIIHNAGLTKSYTLNKYLDVNVGLTEQLISVIKSQGKLNETGRFCYISSLAAKGPVGNGGPASNYGRSKVLAEEAIIQSGLDYMIYRPAGVYGARDIQFVPLIKAVNLGIYPNMTSSNHKMTLINARDAAFNILKTGEIHSRKIVHLEDGEVYEHKDLKRILEGVLNKKSRNLSVPKPIVTSLLWISDVIDKSFNRTPKLSREHYLEISQDWDYDFTEERQEIPLIIKYNLRDGFKDAISYYEEKSLI